MAKKVKLGKITIVISITVLIWVWTDLALDEGLPVSNTIITVAQSNPKLWVTLNGAASVSIEEIKLKGPHRRINELSRKIERQGGFMIDFDAAEEGMGKSNSYSLQLMSFLQKEDEIRRLGLKVEDCTPKIVSVNVVERINKPVTVECLDEDKIPIKAESIESIEPTTVDAYVPVDEMITAKVQLTRREIEQARISAITKTPYIELPGGRIRNVATTVKIKMSPVEDELADYTITTATLGYCFSVNTQGEYRVELLNRTDMAAVRIKATLAAKQVYEQQPYQLILYIPDEYARTTDVHEKEVVFNFPEEYVSRGEIRQLNQEPPEARFRLIPITATESGEEN